jgi:hypothetical protein
MAKHTIAKTVGFTLILLLAAAAAFAQNSDLVAKWSFEVTNGSATKDSVSGLDDAIGGFFKLVPGVQGKGLRFDGYTTSVVRKANNDAVLSAGTSTALGATARVPELKRAFTLDAWVALDTYPWNLVPIIDYDLDNQVGYLFGIDAVGHLVLQAGIKGGWQSLTSTETLPLKRWKHVAATFDADRGLAIYIDGRQVGQLVCRGELATNLTDTRPVDLIIGRVRQPLIPFPSGEVIPYDPIWYSFDGILDEVEIRSRSLGPEEIQRLYASVSAPAGEVLPWPLFPAGPPGPGRFGAYPTTLKYLDTWDRMRRIGPDSDVVVRFDESPARLVFWQGLNYIPAWVTENGIWYTNEFVEAWDPPACNGGTDCEPFSDKQSRYSRVSVIESNDARAVVHWRYALSETRNYTGAFTDPLTGWFDWADEYWTIYPDAVAIRKQVLWSSADLKSESDFPSPSYNLHGHEWQEAMVIHNAGHHPEDDIDLSAVTLANMKGQTATYTWGANTTSEFRMAQSPGKLDHPDDANIQVINLKSAWKPFQIAHPPVGFEAFEWGSGSYATWAWGNHFPVAQIDSSARPAITSDRPSHSSLSHMFWNKYDLQEGKATKILLTGLTTKRAGELADLAKSWVSPPAIVVSGGGVTGSGFDPTQRAFVIDHDRTARPSALTITLQGASDLPIINPAIVVHNWDAYVKIRINGNLVSGKTVRTGFAQRLEGTDLIVWLQTEERKPVRIELEPVAK